MITAIRVVLPNGIEARVTENGWTCDDRAAGRLLNKIAPFGYKAPLVYVPSLEESAANRAVEIMNARIVEVEEEADPEDPKEGEGVD